MVFISTTQWVVQIVEEPKWKRSQIYTAKKSGRVPSKFFFSYLENGHGGMFWPFCEKLWTVEHPERVVSFKKEAERGWKSGVTSLSWKSGWKPWTIRKFWHQRILKILFLLRDTAIWKFQGVQIKFPLYILGPVKLKISITDTNGVKLVWLGWEILWKLISWSNVSKVTSL